MSNGVSFASGLASIYFFGRTAIEIFSGGDSTTILTGLALGSICGAIAWACYDMKGQKEEFSKQVQVLDQENQLMISKLADLGFCDHPKESNSLPSAPDADDSPPPYTETVAPIVGSQGSIN